MILVSTRILLSNFFSHFLPEHMQSSEPDVQAGSSQGAAISPGIHSDTITTRQTPRKYINYFIGVVCIISLLEVRYV